MQRFVYTPQLAVFVHHEESGQVIDVSDDIISGSVSRRLNAMSTAEFTLQNKRGKYLSTTTGRFLFNPMDRIVVYTSRIGSPIPIFSGFLDETPYYALYPGPVTIKASDALKLLKYTFFDPGVKGMSDLFAARGWVYDPSTGEVTDPGGRFGNQDIGGGLKEVIEDCVEKIGGWNPERVQVIKLPDSFINKIAKAMQTNINEEAAAFKALDQRLKTIFSITTPVETPTAPLDPITGGPSGTNGNLTAVQVAAYALRAGFTGNDAVTAVSIAYAESGFRTDAVGYNPISFSGYGGGGTFDLGLWQYNSYNIDHSLHLMQDGGGTGSARIANIDATRRNLMSQMFNPDTNAQKAYALFKSSGWGAWATYGGSKQQSYLSSAQKAVQQAVLSPNLNNPLTPTTTSSPSSTTNVTRTTTNIGPGPFYPLGKQASYGQGPFSGGTHAAGQSWEDCAAIDFGTPIGTPVIAVVNGTIGTQIGLLPSSGSPYANQSNPPEDAVRATFSGRYGGQRLHLFVNGQDSFYYAHLLRIVVKPGQQVKAGDILGYSGEANGVDHLHFAVNTSSADVVNQYAHYKIVDGTMPTGGVVGGTDSSGGGTTDVPTVTPDQVAQIARQSAWFTLQLQTGTNVLESTMLTGKRALANDISLLDWFSRLIPASGRVFTTKPDGTFLAFFPDYFGFYGTAPYWRIADIEVVDLQIQRNDTNLTTHVFADFPVNFQLDLSSELLSQIASIEEPAFDAFINVPEDDPRTAKNEGFNVQDFMRRYGARPWKLDLPDIRNPILAWMASWMEFTRLWAQQFTANARFTYMPELQPGGLVAFGDRISMYVEDVTHSFDRTGGFSTSATLSAPAAINESRFPWLPTNSNLGEVGSTANSGERTGNAAYAGIQQ